MFDKLKTVENYANDIQERYSNIVNACISYTNNLILINSNTKFSIKLLCKYLNVSSLSVIRPLKRDVLKYKSLGDFLRDQSINSHKRTVLILDFGDELCQRNYSIPETVDTININRDLFTEKFNSTIIIAPQKLTYAIRRHARDFWSCVNIFVDTTKWFCSPVMLPIVNLKIDANVTPYLIELYRKNNDEYMRYVSLENAIKRDFIQYGHSSFFKYYESISKFSVACKISLFRTLTENIICAQASSYLHESRIKDLCYLINDECIDITTQARIAEFFYKCGEYSCAIECYRKIYKNLIESWKNESKEYVLAFLSCNILVCEYMQNSKHSPQELELELRKRFALIDSTLEKWQEEYKNNYLFLINSTICHHTYAQHRDILENLKRTSIVSMDMLSFELSFETLLVWETFNYNGLEPFLFKLEDPILTKIYYNLQLMIRSFCDEKYNEAREAYKELKKNARIHGYKQILVFAEAFNKNIIWLYGETLKK